MKTRPIDAQKDIESVLIGCRDFVSRVHGDMLPEGDVLARSVHALIDNPGVVFLAAEHDEEIVGFMAMYFAPFLWNPEEIWGEELFWWAKPTAPTSTALVLLRAAMREAKKRGASVAFKAPLVSLNRLDAVYRRMGLRPIEVNYIGRF